mgnify:CR=1 FL=1
MLGGYAGRVAWIDLGEGQVTYKEVDEQDALM